jgi:hypothetical protein
MHAAQACGAGQPADTLGQVTASALGELDDEPIDAQAPLVFSMNLLDNVGQFRVFLRSLGLAA